MSLQTNIQNGFTAVATDVGGIYTAVLGTATGSFSWTGTATNVVGALNELKTTADAAAVINDTGTSTTSVWSSSKTNTEITNAINGVLDGAPAALDTLNELAAAIDDNASYASSITTALSLKANAADVYTKAEIGSVTTNFGTYYNTARGL